MAESEEVMERLEQLDYPIPKQTVMDLEQIEKELTPLIVDKDTEIIDYERGWLCDSETIRVPYLLVEGEDVRTFTATVVRPSEYLINQRFPEVSKFPAVMIQPTIKGVNRLEQQVALESCLRGLITITPDYVVTELPDELPGLDIYNALIRIEIIRARRLVDYLGKLSDVDVDRIGLIGFSRGAIIGSLLLGVEPAIQYAFFGAGGMGMAQILSRSTDSRIQEEVRRHREALGLSPEEFEHKLIDSIRYDGLLFSHRFDPENLKVMVVNKDKRVPTENQLLLWKAFGEPRAVYYSSGHKQSIVRLVYANGRAIHRFFAERMDSPHASP